jgi:hypothetical protein
MPLGGLMNSQQVHRRENIRLIGFEFYKLVNVKEGINAYDLLRALRHRFPTRNINKYQVQHCVNKAILLGLVEIVSVNPKCYRRVL